jgi:hypothetical protein
VKEYTNEFRKKEIMVGLSPKNPYIFIKYLWDIKIHLWKQVILIKHRTIDEACVYAYYLENMGHKKGK